jgi:hypothetical protein
MHLLDLFYTFPNQTPVGARRKIFVVRNDSASLIFNAGFNKII